LHVSPLRGAVFPRKPRLRLQQLQCISCNATAAMHQLHRSGQKARKAFEDFIHSGKSSDEKTSADLIIA